MNQEYFRIPFNAIVRVSLTSKGADYYYKEWMGKQIYTLDFQSQASSGPVHSIPQDEKIKTLTFPSINTTRELDLEFQLFLLAFGNKRTHRMMEDWIIIPGDQLILTDTHGHRDTVTLKMKKDVADRFYNLLQDIECECDINDIEDTLTVLREALEKYEDDKYAYMY